MRRNQLDTLEDEFILWNMMTQGNERALEKLYSKYYDSMFRYGYRYTTDNSLLEDSIQDVFLNIYNNHSIKAVQSVQAYLLRSMRNMVLHHLSLSKDYSLDEISFDISAEDTLLERLFERDDKELRVSRKLAEAFHSLNDNQKNALYLRYVKDLSYREVAEVLNINIQSAQNLIGRTLLRLKGLLRLLFIVLLTFI